MTKRVFLERLAIALLVLSTGSLIWKLSSLNYSSEPGRQSIDDPKSYHVYFLIQETGGKEDLTKTKNPTLKANPKHKVNEIVALDQRLKDQGLLLSVEMKTRPKEIEYDYIFASEEGFKEWNRNVEDFNLFPKDERQPGFHIYTKKGYTQEMPKQEWTDLYKK